MNHLPANTPVRNKAALTRFVKVAGQTQPTGDYAQTPTDVLVRACLKVAGVQDPTQKENERLKHRQAVVDLANQLEIGILNPLLLSVSDLL